MTPARSSGLLAALIAASAALPASAQRVAQVKRGDLKVTVHVQGTVVAGEMIRLKSEIEGRVEDLDVSTYTWLTRRTPAGFLANKEMAAILDSHTTTLREVVEQRWRKYYHPAPIECPKDCFVMRVFTKNKEWLKPRSLLMEASENLQLVGRVRPEDAAFIRDGQELVFWPVGDPSRKQKVRVTRYVLDVQGERVDPGGSFAINLSPSRYLDPGTKWEGVIVPLVKRGVLMVPTAAVIEKDGQAFVTVRVSTGITTSEYTEIAAGLQDKRPILIFDDSQMGQVEAHRPKLDPGTRQQMLQEQAERRAEERQAASEEAQRQAVEAASEAAAEAAPVASPPPANIVPQDASIIYAPKRRREKAGQLADPDATFSETPDAE